MRFRFRHFQGIPMNRTSCFARAIVSTALLMTAHAASAQTHGKEAPLNAEALRVAPSAGEIASPKERGELTRRFVAKWGAYVQRIYGVPVRTWAGRMAPTFAKADGENFRQALRRDTFEGAMAELSGQGERLSDRQVIDKLASANGGEKVLGALDADLVYTPITPCRIADTRVTGGGPLTAGGTRSFFSVNSASYTVQGGSATNCGLLGVVASAVAINITAVTPSAAGYATVYPFGAPQPLAASVNYTAGAIVNNTVVTRIPNPLQSSDFTVFSFAQAHYVIDIVGYFAPPQATLLDCVNTSVQTFTIAANTMDFFNNPTCPTGYRPQTPYCWTAAGGVVSQGSGFNANVVGNTTFCAWQNTTAASQTVFGGNVCCRVPGR
jgi:hypothetical protein